MLASSGPTLTKDGGARSTSTHGAHDSTRAARGGITAPRDDLAYLLANVGPLLALIGVNPAVVAGVVDSHANESGAH
jgi:hypothetical protein